jgi:hypothetical protein
MPPIPAVPPVPVNGSPPELPLHALKVRKKDKVSKDTKIRCGCMFPI